MNIYLRGRFELSKSIINDLIKTMHKIKNSNKKNRSDFVEIDGFEDLQIITRGHLKIGTFTKLCKSLISEAHQTKLKQQK